MTRKRSASSILSTPVAARTNESPRSETNKPRSPKKKKKKEKHVYWAVKGIIAENEVDDQYLVVWEGIDPKTKKDYEPSW